MLGPSAPHQPAGAGGPGGGLVPLRNPSCLGRGTSTDAPREDGARGAAGWVEKWGGLPLQRAWTPSPAPMPAWS